MSSTQPIATPVKKKAPEWTFTLEIAGETITASGDTCLSALESLQRPDKITTKGVLTVAHGAEARSHTMTVRDLKRLFYPICRPYHAKKLSHAL